MNNSQSHFDAAPRVPLADVLFTDELDRRPARPTDYQAENRALVALAQSLADSPGTILQSLAETILGVLGCGSAGVSLLTPDKTRFYWPAIAGVWQAHLGGGTPRDFGPCGDVLDCGHPLLFKHLERRYTYFLPLTPAIEECLLVPFYVEGQAVGTIWAISHDPHARQFDHEDLRLLLSLGRFAASAFWAMASLGQLERMRLDAETQRRNADLEQRVRLRTNELLQSETRFHLLVNSVQDYAIFMLDPHGNIVSWNSGAQRMKGYAPDEIIGQHFSRFYTPEDNAQGQPLHGLSMARQAGRYEVEGWRVRRDGSRFWADVVISAVHDEAGELIGFAKVTRDLTERKQIDEEVRQSREQLRQLSAHLERAREEERRHLSRELHDELGGSLTGLKMNVVRLRRLWPDKADDLTALSAEIDRTIQKVRGIAIELRPAMLDDFGLVATLDWLVQDFAGRTGIDCKFESALETLDLGSDANIGIYRTVQESLTNIARHAQATAVVVMLTEAPTDAILSVADNGQGFLMAEAVQKHSLGLVGMRERVRALSGQLEIASAPGQGTTITVKIPKPVDLQAELPPYVKPNPI